MSRGKRGREGSRKSNGSSRRSAPPALFEVPEACDCPACTGMDIDPEEMIDGLLATGAGLIEDADPLEAEIVGAALLSVGGLAGDAALEEELVGQVMPGFEARATPEALAMLLAIGSMADGRAGKAASAAADRLVDAGVSMPGWAAELREPVTVADCCRLTDEHGYASMLTCVFHRAGRSHAVAISVDHIRCGAAADISLFEADQMPEAREKMRAAGREHGTEISTEQLDPAEFRWQVENALDARAVHDAEDPIDPMDAIDDLAGEDDDGTSYPAMARLVRSRMSALPAPSKAAAPHGHESDSDAAVAALQALTQLVRSAGGQLDAGAPARSRGRKSATALPAKRKRSDQPAPIYQIKVGLVGAKPPIWRRLQVPADISLATLNTVIQVAFDWNGGHLHVFETPYGDFGRPDTELGHQSDSSVTLGQVAPGAKSKIRYTYDFGDDWQHDIQVEKVLEGDDAASCPRCIDGRRAAPPDDCGGIWGYADLAEILADPLHPEHEEKLDWMGFDTGDDFDPTEFTANDVNVVLAKLFGK